MKLRLDLSEEDIAYRFRISQSTVSRISGKWIKIMAESLKFLIRWPSRDEGQPFLATTSQDAQLL